MKVVHDIPPLFECLHPPCRFQVSLLTYLKKYSKLFIYKLRRDKNNDPPICQYVFTVAWYKEKRKIVIVSIMNNK